MRKEIKEALSKGMPVLAECGGFMYLHDTFEDEKGIFRQGVGQIKGKVFNTGKLSRFGYIEASCKKDVYKRQPSVCQKERKLPKERLIPDLGLKGGFPYLAHREL